MKENRNILIGSIIGAITIIVLWALSAYLIMSYYTDYTLRGTFGDQFGAINALFSGLAFLGVIIAIILQKKELAEQRKEIKQSRIAHSESAKALTKQSKYSEISARLNSINHVLEGLDRQIIRVSRSGRSDSDVKVKELEAKQIEYENQLDEMLNKLKEMEIQNE